MKMTVKVAAPSARPFILNEKHFTSLGFNQLIPVYSREVLPGDKFQIKPDAFARASVPYLPNMGEINLHLRAFYVPFVQVFTPFNSFINGIPTPSNNGSLFHQVSNVCTLSRNAFCTFFNATSYGNTVSTPSGQKSDIIFQTISGSAGNETFTASNRQLTLKGKIALHVMQALGYNFNYIIDSNNLLYTDEYVSALPLLAFFKAYLDYYVPSRFQPTHPLHLIIKEIANSTTPSLTLNDLKNLFDNFFLYSDHNYFTNAWLTPNAPAPNLNNFGIQTANSPTNSSVSSSDTTAINNNGGVQNDPQHFVELLANKVTDLGINMLKKFSSFIRRNNFAGSRAIERLLARFGVHAPEQIMDMCQYLGSMTLNVQNIEVTSNADTSASGDPSNLGDYAGMQYLVTPNESKKTFEVDVQRHGMVFVIASLGVPSMFTDGIRRHLYHIQPTSFYTPEFDGTILQAINSSELVGSISPKTQSDLEYLRDTNLLPGHAMGFTERFAEYKTTVDTISGDFNIPRLANSIDPFILPRRIINKTDYVLGSNSIGNYNYFGLVPTTNPMTPDKYMTQTDSGQFNRIFRDLLGFADPYYFRFIFNVIAQRRMLNSDETAELLGYGEQKKFDSTGSNYN